MVQLNILNAQQETRFRIFDRYGLGATLRYINKSTLFDRENQFTVGGDLFYQTGPISDYNSINGKKGDNYFQLKLMKQLETLEYIYLNNLELYNKKLFFLVSGRYDNVYFIS